MKPSLPWLTTRREALKHISAGALLTMGLWPGALSAGIFGWGNHRDFRFIVVNDLHYLDEDCGRWLTGVVDRMKSHQAEFCLIVGDVTDDGKREHFAAATEIFRALGIPVYPVIGNHDYLTQTDRSAYVDAFPDRLNYHFEHRGWQFIGLDTSEGLHYQETEISRNTFRWLDDHLGGLSQRQPTVLFTHFPMGAGVRYRPRNADALLDRLRVFNLQAVYNGHFHAFTETRLGSTVLTTNQCCALKRNNHDGTREKGYFLCSIRNGSIQRTFVECPVPVAPAKISNL